MATRGQTASRNWAPARRTPVGDLPPRVLLVTTSYPRRADSFEGRFVQSLAQALALRTQVTVLAPHAAGSPRWEIRAGVSIERFGYAPSGWETLAYGDGGIPENLRRNRLNALLLAPFALSLTARLVQLARHHEVIHANWSFTGLFAVLSRSLHRRPVVVTLRGSDARMGVAGGVPGWLHAITLRGADRVTSVNRAFVAGRDPRRFRFVPNGVEIPGEGAPREHLGPYRFLVSGNLVPGKRVELALRALRRVAERGGDATLEIVGDGPERGDLARLAAELGIAGRVHFRGRLVHAQAVERLAQADCLLQPSAWEGRSNAVLEAMAAARVFIASDVPGNRELAGDETCGLLFAGGCPEDLACRMERLMVDSALGRRLGAAGRRAIREQGLTWEQCAQRYLELFEELAGGPCAAFSEF